MNEVEILRDMIEEITITLEQQNDVIHHLTQLKDYFMGLSTYHEKEVRRVRTALTKTKCDLLSLMQEQPNLQPLVNHIDSTLGIQDTQDCEELDVTISFRSTVKPT